MEVDEEFDQTSDIYPHWMAAQVRLKNEFTEDEKKHNLMRWLNDSPVIDLLAISDSVHR